MFIAINQTLVRQQPAREKIEEIRKEEIADAVPNNDIQLEAHIRVDDQIMIEKW